MYDGKNILVVTGSGEPFADTVAEMYVDQIGSEGGGEAGGLGSGEGGIGQCFGPKPAGLGSAV